MLEHTLHTIQANVNRSIQATETLLDLACYKNIDILLLQEPWLLRDQGKEYKDTRSIAHIGYNQLLPQTTSHSIRPQTLTYVRKGLRCQVTQTHLNDGDIQSLLIKDKVGQIQILNVYNEKDTSKIWTIERCLYNCPLLSNTILVGDFNTRHPIWDPQGTNTSTQATRLVEWIQDNEFLLQNVAGQGTFYRPNMEQASVLDLTFTKGTISRQDVRWHTNQIGSDHLAIGFTIPGQDRQRPTENKVPDLAKVDWNLFTDYLQLKEKTIDLTQTYDQVAEAFTSLIQAAMTHAIPMKTVSSRSKPWWNPELRTLRRLMSRAYQQTQDHKRHSVGTVPLDDKRRYLTAKNIYFQAIKTAKKNHWNAFLEKGDSKSIFKAMAYTKQGNYGPIPTINGHNTFQGKCQAITSTLFPLPPKDKDLPPRWASYSVGNWDWPRLSEAELGQACSTTKVKGKTPGPDKITQAIISKAYLAMPNTFFEVYSPLIDTGYHPKCWKQATGIVLAKPGKPDYSKPKAYRVISLLNCLGKVSERILAQRLGTIAEKGPLLHESQIGGRKKKSAIDAALLLTSEIETNRKMKKKTSVVFLDVKGAFDHVAKNRLLRTMIKLRLPHSLIRWTESFFSERQLRLSFDGQSEEFKEIEIGIPQGSPISPILFLIYIRNIFEPLQGVKPLSYIDDIGLITSSTSLRKNAATLEREVDRLTELGRQNSIEFDLAKTELIHFTKGKGSKTSITLPSKDKIEPTQCVRWLGVWFDPHLLFKNHIRIRSMQAEATFQRLERLANIERGLSAKALRQLYLACVTTVADYGSEIWWKPKKAVRPLETIQGRAAKKILGVFQTAPNLPSEIEANLFPVKLRLQNKSIQYAIRVKDLQSNHPMRQLLESTSPAGQYFVQRNGFQELVQTDKGSPTQMQLIRQHADHYRTGTKAVKQGQAKIDLLLAWERLYKKEQTKRLSTEQNPTSYFWTTLWSEPLKQLVQGKRKVTSAFYMLYLGHGYLKSYLYRMGLTGNNLCHCGQRETREHLVLSCPEYASNRPRDFHNLWNIGSLYKTLEGRMALLKFIDNTGIATRQWHLQRNEENEENEENGIEE